MSIKETVQHTSRRAVVIYSGGLDSYTLLNKVIQDVDEVLAISFNYGQKHVKELAFAKANCTALNVKHRVLDISAIHELFEHSSLTGELAIPEGHYEEASMKSTVVPNRNMIMLSLAMAYAISEQADTVYYGAHSGDHAIYPDCRPEFVARMDALANVANYEPLSIQAPFIDLSKGEIVALGLGMNLDYSQAWTCYNGRDLACGKCGACVERLEAFSVNAAIDPIAYEASVHDTASK